MNNVITQFNTFFTKLSKKQKVSLVSVISFLILSTTAFVFYTFTPHYAVLFTDLSTENAAKLTYQLDSQHIPYELNTQGNTIFVDKLQVANTRLKLMNNDLNLNGHVGFELFDKSDFGMTNFSQQVNMQRALQGELERTIKSLNDVADARVHLVMPEKNLFAKENSVTKGSVTLKLSHGYIAPSHVKSIQRLIAASIDGLSIKHVTVIDERGKTLSSHKNKGGALTTQLKEKQAIESYLSNKAYRLLQMAYQNRQFIVNVDVSLDYDLDKKRQERIVPVINNKGLLVSLKEHHRSNNESIEKNTANNDVEKEEKYQYSKEIEEVIRSQGHITHIGVSVIVPKGTDIKEQAQIRDLVANVTGIELNRGDKVSVAALATYHRAKKHDEFAVKNISMMNTTYFSKSVAIAALFLVLLLLIFLFTRPKRLSKVEVDSLLSELEKLFKA